MATYRSRKHQRIVIFCIVGILTVLYFNDVISTWSASYLVRLDLRFTSGMGELDQTDETGDSDMEASGIPEEVQQQNKNYSFIPIQTAADFSELKTRFSLCLATQTTVDRLGTINRLASYWRGPIELVVFLRTFTELTILQRFLQFAQQCYEDNEWLLRTVSIQLAYANDMFREQDQEYLQNITVNSIDCEEFNTMDTRTTPEELLEALMKQYIPEGPDPKFVYPQNHMRNRAKHACAAHFDWVTVLDVDIIPKMGAAEALQSFWSSDEARACTKCAYVLPVYELEKPCYYPRTKHELLDMAAEKKAVPFHFTFWKQAHRDTDYAKWSKTSLEEGPIHISHESTYKLKVTSLKEKKRHNTYFYEPFYISHSSIPDYSERFMGFGFTRSTQAFHALVTGWKFVVLSPVFVSHCGIQKGVKKDSFKKIPRYQQVAANRKIYIRFVDELLKEYHKNHKR